MTPPSQRAAGFQSTTPSCDEQSDTWPLEWSALRDHFDLCKGQTGHLFRVLCGAESVHRFLAGRLVTTLVGVALVPAVIAALA